MKIAPTSASPAGESPPHSTTFGLREGPLRLAELEAAIGNTSDGVMMATHQKDENGAVEIALTFVNPAFERITGYSSAEVLGRSPRLLQGKDTDENAVEALRRVIASGTAHKVTLLNYRKDGTPFWNAMQIAPMRAENGEPSGWIGYLSDVSARVEAENALRQSQENLAAAQKLTHLGSWVMELPENSTDTPNLFWSDEVFRILGLEVGSVTPSRQFYLSLIHPDDREEAIQLEAALAAGTGFDICYRVLRPDGTARTVEVCARVEQDEQSDGAAPRRVIGTILDITERHEAETLARGANRNLQLVLQNAPIVLWALDTQGIVTLIQGQSLQQLVDRAGGHVGRSIFEIYQGDAMICDLARRALTGVEAAGIVQTNGLSFDVKYSPLRDENGAFRGAVGLAHDITERRAIEAALFDSQKQLHTVIDTVPMVIWAVDAEGIYTFRQGRALEMLGQKPGEGVGQSIFEFYGQDGAKARCVRSALAGETGQELCPMRPDLVFEVHYAPSRDENGAINGVVGVSYVVTERELARRELAQSESRFNHIVANAPGMVYSFRRDLQGEISLLYVSDGCREIYGHEPDFILSHPRAVLEIVHPGNRDAFWASIDVSQQNLTPWRWEGRIERTDGEMRWVRGESRPAHQEDGSTIWDGLIIDVTKSYLSEQEALKSRRALDEAQALAHIGSFEWALESGEIRWSDEMFRLLGLDPGAFRPTLAEVFLLVVPAERDAIRRRALANLVTANADSMIVPVTRSDGQIRWLQTHARAETDAQGGSLTVVGSAQDITDSLEASRALGESEQRYALAAQGANDGLWDWNLETDRIYFSPRWKTMLGYAENEIGDRPTEWLGRIYPDDTEPFRTALSSHFARNTEHFECEYRLLNAGGAIVWMLCRALAIFDENGAAIRIVGSQTDITKRKVAEAELSRNAFYDKLTGLPNRTLFLERLENTLALARRSPEYAFAALFLDLDRFKKINDSLGHHAGDRLLVEAAARFGRCLRPGDTVARLGSDEFALLIDDVRSDEDVALVTGRIKSELEAPFIIEGKEIFVTVSIGIAPSRGSQESAEELLRNADSAMYRAKSLGRARFETFDASMHQRALSLLELEADLWRAIERDELSLFYQPIISLESGQISGYEALIRWHHPVRGLISPADFIPIAEENGFILILGWWVLEIACHQAKAWDDLRAARFPDQKPHFMSVNLSSRQFSQPDMVEQVRTTIQRSGADPTRLTLEITESVIMEHSEVAATALRGLKKLGIHLSMDDFGTGYSSLSYLHRFSLDTLKIDRSFISQMRPGAREGEIVNTILHLAEGLDMRVVAEGVETVEQLAGLRRMGCGYAQGFLMARPMPAAQIEALWNTAPSW